MCILFMHASELLFGGLHDSGSTQSTMQKQINKAVQCCPSTLPDPVWPWISQEVGATCFP